MLALSLKEYLLVLEATHKNYGLMERLYGFIIDALETLDAFSHNKESSRLQPLMSSMKRLFAHSGCFTKRWMAVLASIDLELRTAESIRLLFEKVLGADCVAPVLRRMDYSCFIHDHQNTSAFLKGQQLKLKEGIGWLEKQAFKIFDEPQRQLFRLIQASLSSIDTLLAANSRLQAMVQGLIQADVSRPQYDVDGQAFQNLLQHCQRWSLRTQQAAFMDRVLGRLKPIVPVQGVAYTGSV